jgi:hypothetical protein
MYPMKLMPDPKGGLRLLKYGCKVTFAKDTYIEPSKVLGPEDLVADGANAKKAKEKRIPVWLVTIHMPRKFVDDAYDGVLEFEDEEVDIEDINAAWDENLDSEDASKEQEVQDVEDPREGNEEGNM